MTIPGAVNESAETTNNYNRNFSQNNAIAQAFQKENNIPELRKVKTEVPARPDPESFVMHRNDSEQFEKRLFGSLASGTSTDLGLDDELNKDGNLNETRERWGWRSAFELIHPASEFRRTWDLIVGVAVLYCAVCVPISAAFLDILAKRDRLAIAILDWIADGIFILDIFINFNTGYYSAEGEVILSRAKITKRYVCTWFFIDFFSTFPFNLIQSGPGSQLPRLIRLFKLFRLVKLLKLVKMVGVLKDLESEMSGEEAAYIMKLLKLLFFIGLCIHVNACLWHFVHTVHAPLTSDDPEYDESGQALTWLIYFFGDDWSGIGLSTRYLTCVYFTVTTYTSVGYGDIIPMNDDEMCMATATEMVGAFVFAFIIGNANSIISQHGAKENELRHKMDEINMFIRTRTLPRDMATKVRRHYERYYEQTIVMNENTILGNLNENLKQEVALYVFADVIAKVPFLAHGETSLVTELCTAFGNLLLGAMEQVYMQGSLGQEMYILQLGSVECFMGRREAAKQVMTLEEGSFFGEEALVSEQPIRRYSVVTKERCDMYSLSRAKFDEATASFPELHDELFKLSQMRIDILKSEESASPQTTPAALNRHQSRTSRLSVGEVLTEELPEEPSTAPSTTTLSDFSPVPPSTEKQKASLPRSVSAASQLQSARESAITPVPESPDVTKSNEDPVSKAWSDESSIPPVNPFDMLARAKKLAPEMFFRKAKAAITERHSIDIPRANSWRGQRNYRAGNTPSEVSSDVADAIRKASKDMMAAVERKLEESAQHTSRRLDLIERQLERAIPHPTAMVLEGRLTQSTSLGGSPSGDASVSPQRTKDFVPGSVRSFH